MGTASRGLVQPPETRPASEPAQADPLTPPAQGSAEERPALHVAEPPVRTSVSSRTDKRSVAKPPVSLQVAQRCTTCAPAPAGARCGLDTCLACSEPIKEVENEMIKKQLQLGRPVIYRSSGSSLYPRNWPNDASIDQHSVAQPVHL